MLTEQINPQTSHLDQMTTLEIVAVINREDQSVAHAVATALEDIALVVQALVERMKRGGRLIYVGAGTSGRLALIDAVECVPTFGTPPELVQAVMAGGDKAITRSIEGAEDNREAARKDLKSLQLQAEDCVIGIAASGRTPYVIAAVEYARTQGCLTVGFACNEGTPLLEAAERRICVPVGAEVIAGSTRMKAGSAQKMVLNTLSTATMVKMGRVYGNLMVDVSITNEKLLHRAQRMLAHLVDIDQETAAQLLAKAQNNVKVAVVMQQLKVSLDEAKAALARADGYLRDVLEQES